MSLIVKVVKINRPRISAVERTKRRVAEAWQRQLKRKALAKGTKK